MTGEELKQFEPPGGWRRPKVNLFGEPTEPRPPAARGPEPGDAGLEAERQRYLDRVIAERDQATP